MPLPGGLCGAIPSGRLPWLALLHLADILTTRVANLLRMAAAARLCSAATPPSRLPTALGISRSRPLPGALPLATCQTLALPLPHRLPLPYSPSHRACY